MINYLKANMYKIILAFLIAVFVIACIKKLFIRIHNISKSRIEKLLYVYENQPLAFEAYIADLYTSLGYKTELTPGSGDCGKDIVMHHGKLKYAVEVKLYAPDHKISREKIQKLHSAMIDIDADCGIFVTTSDFTAPAAEYAKKYNIETVNGDKLSKMIKKSGIA